MDRAFILLLLVGACYSLLPFPDHWGYNVQSQVTEEVTTQVTEEVTTQVTKEVTTQVTEEVPSPIWSKTTLACIEGHDNKELNDITFEDCKDACVRETEFVCRSVDYWPGGLGYPIICQLSTSNSTSNAYEEPCCAPYDKKNIYAEIVSFVAECPSPWFRVGPQCFRTSGMVHNWTSARDYCSDQAPGGDLAQPIDIKALVEYMKSHGMDGDYFGDWYWLGGSDLLTEGDWRWLNGSIIDRGWQKAADWEKINFPDHYPTRIREDQPNDYRSGQDCLSVEIYHVMLSARSMGDLECDSRLFFLCERH